MIHPASPEGIILALVHRRGTASAVEIGTACRMTPGDVRRRLMTLENARFISGRYATSASPRRIYFITAEGRSAAGIIDARSTT